MHVDPEALPSLKKMYADPEETVVVKLRSSAAPVSNALAGFDRGPLAARAVRAMSDISTTAGRLGALLENGYVVSMRALFPAPPLPSAVTAARTPATLLKPRKAASFFTMKLERGTNSVELAAHLNTLEDVEVAYVPAIRYPLRKKAAKAPPAIKPDDPLLARQWGHAAVRIHEAREAPSFKDAQGVTVAVVDSGIDAGHPDLKGIIRSYRNAHAGREDDRDYMGHGTHVAGIIAAAIGNGVGVSGLCRAGIDAIKALPRPGTAWTEEVHRSYLQALAMPLDNEARVVNLSLGSPRSDPAEAAVIADLLDAGVVVVAAMGNDYAKGNPTSYPAAYPGVIAVGASDELDRRAGFSCTGPHIALVAPGERILSTVPMYPTYFSPDKVEYDSWPGTSMATPHVAAAAALLLAKRPKLTPAEVRTLLMGSADKVLGSTSFNPEYGAGRLNIAQLLA